MEYPYGASKLRPGDKRVLDVGSAKADPVWMSWLESLPAEVHAMDFDLPTAVHSRVRFVCADVRDLPYPDDYFDAVLAVSVIEHIGLHEPQVTRAEKPAIDKDGDLHAVREISRVLRPGGQLIMTLPYTQWPGLILRRSARAYNMAEIGRFKSVLSVRDLDVLEYRSTDHGSPRLRHRLKRGLSALATSLVRWVFHLNVHQAGLVKWEKVDPALCKARNRWHVDAVACGVWVKPECDRSRYSAAREGETSEGAR